MKTNDKLFFMQKAINLAKKAFNQEEIPVGAVIVKDGNVISACFNKRNKKQIATSHAEVLAIEKACKKLGSWRLNDCEMYVSLMPCPMCAGAIVNARIKKVYYGAENGNKELFEKILTSSELNHKTSFEQLFQEDCSKILKDFFASKRNKN